MALPPQLQALSNDLRRRRFEFFRRLIAPLARPVHIIDIGGTERFWLAVGMCDPADVHITLVNLAEQRTQGEAFISVTGDARDLREFGLHQFDVAFSNSVIEHVGELSDQRRMAAEVMRVGKRYFVQTPNRYFPLEPNSMLPGFQFVPFSSQVWMMQRFRLGAVPRQPDRARAEQIARATHLMSRGELLSCFPNAHLREERLFGFVKSHTVYAGFD